MNQTQAAPSPDYAMSEHPIDLVIRYCADCGDICLTVGRDVRCDTCQVAHADEMRTAARALVLAATAKVLAHPTADIVRRSSGMNDEREILCDECGECAATYNGCADLLDGKACMCMHCDEPGKIVVSDDEGITTIRFRAYTAREIAVIGNGGQR